MKVTHEKPIITINNLLYLYIHLKTNEKLFIVKNVRVCVRACVRAHTHTHTHTHHVTYIQGKAPQKSLTK